MTNQLYKRKLAVSAVVFLIFFGGGAIGNFLIRGSLSRETTTLGVMVSLLFAAVMYFVIDEAWLVKNSAAHQDPANHKRRVMFWLVGIPGGLAGLLFLAQTKHPFLYSLLFTGFVYALEQLYLGYWERSGRLSQQQVTNVREEIGSGIRRGRIGGIIFAVLLVVFFILYYLYLGHSIKHDYYYYQYYNQR